MTATVYFTITDVTRTRMLAIYQGGIIGFMRYVLFVEISYV